MFFMLFKMGGLVFVVLIKSVINLFYYKRLLNGMKCWYFSVELFGCFNFVKCFIMNGLFINKGYFLEGMYIFI